MPPPDVDTPLNLRNAAYAVQWWVFGLFAIWMWWKMFRAEQQADEPCRLPREKRSTRDTYPQSLAKPKQIRSALSIYRVLAITAGIALFILIVEMVMKYVLDQTNVLTEFWSPIHGLIYMGYAAAVANLGIKCAWGPSASCSTCSPASCPSSLDRRAAQPCRGRGHAPARLLRGRT